MPKEVIQDELYGQFDEYRQVEVRWARDAHFQIATVTNLEPSTGDKVDGIFINLNRGGINRLIRSLRKARDQVYGSDA